MIFYSFKLDASLLFALMQIHRNTVHESGVGFYQCGLLSANLQVDLPTFDE